jgi:hypothetical protein
MSLFIGVTVWPRLAATRAASIPDGPPPTTITFFSSREAYSGIRDTTLPRLGLTRHSSTVLVANVKTVQTVFSSGCLRSGSLTLLGSSGSPGPAEHAHEIEAAFCRYSSPITGSGSGPHRNVLDLLFYRFRSGTGAPAHAAQSRSFGRSQGFGIQDTVGVDEPGAAHSDGPGS